MGDFRRQPSKVWWSTYEDEDLSKYSGLLNWGKGVDLSGNFETINNNRNSTSEKNESKNSSSFFKPENTHKEEDEEEMKKSENKRESLESDRGSSSSPSQGSHKSQDSGFSDSEIQNNACSLSPQNSPELSSRLSCAQCKSREETKIESSQNEISYNVTVVNYRKLKTSVKNLPISPEIKENKFLETSFNSHEESPKKDKSLEEKSVEKTELSSTKQKNRKSIIKSHISRTKLDTREKINQIQNQLELSFKLPKKINLTQNLKIFTNHGKPQENQGNQQSVCDETKLSKKTESVSSCLSGNGTVVEQCNGPRSLDSEGFKIPKLPSEQSLVYKSSSNNFLDLTDIEGPPISSSTPKSCKFQGRESPVPRAARATEKKLTAKTTFATIRKLKGLSDKKLKTPVNLLNSFNRCSENVAEKEKPRIDCESSVKHWLSELETMYEAEIMTTLQSKSLATDLTRQVTNMADTTSQTVRQLHQKTRIISSEFSILCHQTKNKRDKQIESIVKSLVQHISEFIQEYVQKTNSESLVSSHQRKENKNQREKDKTNEQENCHEMITDFRQPEPETVEVKKETKSSKSKEDEVLESCTKLKELTSLSQLDHERIETEVSNLGKKFTEVVDVLLESHIQALVRVLEEPRTELALRTALSALTTLGLEGNHLSHLVSNCGGIRALLAVCLEARATAVRVSALRALTTVCCVSGTIRQFEQAGGVEIISDILADERRSEAELSEAAAVIAQITAPWVQDNHSVEGLSQFLSSLVTSLTRIVNKFRSSETLLLASAALANLTFMEPRTVWPLLENETAKILLAAVRRQGAGASVFIQEQAATIIANMASIPECRKHLAEQRAVVALLCFLEIHHSPLQRAPEITAAERVQQKSAIALSRLCSDAVVAKQVVELKGVNRLVKLCKEEKERNHSDGVLVACLAALRKIVANCGTEALEELNAMELVEPRLLDSFLLYSSKQESYV